MIVRTSVVLLLLALAGCSSNQKEADLEAFYDKVENEGKGRIDPLPPFEQVAPFNYQAVNLRSPFEPPVVIATRKPPPSGRKVRPDEARSKQYLEQFNIGQLAMVGTLEQSGQLYGLIRDVEAVVTRVRSGDYMGTDHGRIIRIDDTSIELLEIIADGAGGWVERQRLVTMGGERG
ncbi:MAG: pilus assembly protein PilP [Pseudomonadota bacterium]